MTTHSLFTTGDPDLVEGSSARSLAHLAEQAAWCTPESCGAAATVITDRGAADVPTAVTHPDLSALVSVQWESGEGPIPAALDTGRATAADDLLHENRWPAYRARALEAGVRSSATLPYHRDGIALTITVYGFRPGLTVEKGCTATDVLGELAATALARERRYREALVEVDQLDTALRTRPVVDQACGILMYVLGCDADTAFNALRRLSQRTNRKLSDLAAALVRTRGHGLEPELRTLCEEKEGDVRSAAVGGRAPSQGR
ncbi:ANTAR domain-containing protein [Streptomyces sp. MST-110588]|uniref:ANTAR domain-containing response regulator n=1 Tax=Streptomyces sp. MST-110588 TaxID=2833628 RepID=UPI001F5C9011|nr:ANTAR domain-containing protein [Streptomyces sp. MST-110588]UNO39223.1 ANTAR domain-containing protein [Streptomyces sp. MST-110588]